MTVLATPIRGLRMMTVAAALMMLRFALELLMAVWALSDETSLETLLTWSARLQLLDLTSLTLLIVGVASSLGEVRRRRLSVVPAAVALAAFVLTFLVHAWLYKLMTSLADGFRNDDLFRALADLKKVPERILIATVAYAVGLFSTVRMIRGYAMTDGNLGLREQARAIAGMLIVLLIADTFYRFTYGLGGGEASFGIMGLAVAIGLTVFWFWCHRMLGSLYDTAKYYLRANADVAIAEVRLPPAAIARTPSVPPIAPPPKLEPLAPAPKLEPLAAAAPVAPAARIDDAPPSNEGGPRFLR